MSCGKEAQNDGGKTIAVTVGVPDLVSVQLRKGRSPYCRSVLRTVGGQRVRAGNLKGSPAAITTDQKRHPPGGRSDYQSRTVTLAGTGPVHRRCGFSLIELVVVLVLMGILASLASMSVRGVIIRQRLARAAEVVEQFDTALRRSALIRRRDVTGVIDRNGRRLVVDSTGNPSITFQLPGQVDIDSIRFDRSKGSSAGNRFVVGSRGNSPSYALRLVSGSSERWVLFAGGTGQIVRDVDRNAVNALLGAR